MVLAFVLFGLAQSGTVAGLAHPGARALLGVTNAVDMPTRQAFAVEMVGRDDVANAVALNSAIFNGARIIGPAVAGLDDRRLRHLASRSCSTASASSP